MEGGGSDFVPSPTSKRTPNKPTQIRVKFNKKNYQQSSCFMQTWFPPTIIPFSQSPCKAASITCIVTFSFFVQILILRLQFSKCFQQGHLSFWNHRKGQRRHHLPHAPHTILEYLQRNLSFVQFCWKVKIHEQQSCSSARFSFYRGLFT